jgi:predicted nucleotidyltransferase
MKRPHIEIPSHLIAEFCRRNHVRQLAFFGSVVRDDFGPDSDIDVLVEFEPGARVGMRGWQGWKLSFRESWGEKWI